MPYSSDDMTLGEDKTVSRINPSFSMYQTWCCKDYSIRMFQIVDWNCSLPNFRTCDLVTCAISLSVTIREQHDYAQITHHT